MCQSEDSAEKVSPKDVQRVMITKYTVNIIVFGVINSDDDIMYLEEVEMLLVKRVATRLCTMPQRR